ncbi:hypothetical protein A6R68_02003, partial [Neotoma lepida]
MQWVKILFNKENTLVQMADGSQAQLALSHLNRHKLPGKSVCITMLSKQQSVQLPCKLGPKNFQNLFPLLVTLHISNFPPLVYEEGLQSLFSNASGMVKGSKLFQKDCKM